MRSPVKKKINASVIIPAYNAEKTLPACIDALLAQSRLPDEIIVVDDGSTDSTSQLAGAYSLVTLIQQKNKGPAHARNAGARAAKTNIVVFVDSDCVPEKNWLEEMLFPFADENVVGVQGAYKTKQKSTVAKFDQIDIEYRYERMKKSTDLDWIGSYSAAYRRKVFLDEGGFDETFPKASGEDSELSYRLAEKKNRLVFNPAAVVWHTHPENLTRYFEIKFFRAYWRTRMYLKHPKKMIQDSYTPGELKINVLMGFIFTFFLSGFIAAMLLAGATSLRVDVVLFFSLTMLFFLTILLVFPKFLLYIFKRDKSLLPIAIVLIFSRSIAFTFGLMAGLLDRRVRA